MDCDKERQLLSDESVQDRAAVLWMLPQGLVLASRGVCTGHHTVGLLRVRLRPPSVGLVNVQLPRDVVVCL